MAGAEVPRKSSGRIVAFLTTRWFLSAIGVLSIALLVWFLGPLLPFLGSISARILAVAAVLAVWLIANLVLDLRAAKRESAMIDNVASAGARESSTDAAAVEEMGILRERLSAALVQLRKSQAQGNRKRQYLYELPWYILIGPPGSGKTTALMNSGLNFPLSDKFGRDPLRGVGGTRNCDWWFSDDAILLDTAGRYATQDSNQAVDHKVWLGFLGLLKQFRPRQPINGAVVAIGIPDLLQMKAVERSAHARAIKSRLTELQSQFSLRVPVYVMFTKMDRIAGFVEFFHDLNREDRTDVWGMTFPLDDGAGQTGAIGNFDTEYDALVERLNARLLDRVHDERDYERRGRIFGFPVQVAGLKGMLHDFLGEIFAPNRFEDRPLLRGIYFSSATQEGTPIDRLMGAMAATFGLTEQRPPAFSGPGRSYFVTRLLRDVIFEEAGLAGSDPKAERRDRLLRAAALGGIAAAALLLVAAWTVSYFRNASLIADEMAAGSAYAQVAAPLVQASVGDENVAPVMPVLDRMRTLPAGYDTAKQSVPFSRGLGLDQGRKLESQAIRSYRRSLTGLLLPRLVLGMQTQLEKTVDNPSDAGTFLRLYLMLGGQGPLDKGLVKSAVSAMAGARAYPNLAADDSRKWFEAHIDALLEEPLPAIELNAALLMRARDQLASIPLSARAYDVVRTGAAARALPVWRVIDHAGAAGNQVFMRGSGKPLTEGVPGFFSYDGFHKVLLPQIGDAIKAAADESWVLGSDKQVRPSNDDVRRLTEQAVDLYVRDFTSAWDGLLGDVRIVRFGNTQQAANVLNALSGPGSPLKAYFTAVAQETNMNRPAAPAAAAAGAAAAAAVNANPAAAAIAKLAQSSPGLEARGQGIDMHYTALREFTGNGSGSSQLDELIKRFAELYMQLSSQALGGAPSASAVSAVQLSQLASNLPPGLGAIVSDVAGGTSSLATGATRKSIEDQYASSVLRFCRQALDGRYPMQKASTIDVAIGDFTQLFKPGGALDLFFASNLKPYVNTTTTPWSNQKVNNSDLGLSSGTLAQFERADRIRANYFGGGAAPSVEFTLMPTALSNEATQVVFDLDGQVLTYARGAATPMRMQWPGPNAAGRAHLAISRNGQSAVLDATGPWALFRLLDRARITGNLPDQLNVTFETGGLTASFQLRATSVRNPFRSRDLEQFQCPAQL